MAAGALWLVRHAVPVVAAGTCYGRLDLPAEGPATQQAARTLAAALPAGARMVASPRQRCTQFAAALQALRPDLRRADDDPRIAEMDFGDWEGCPWSSIGPAALDAWTADFAHHAPGGGESVAGFMARVAAAWDDHRANPDAATVWVTHVGVIRAAALLAAGTRSVSRAADWPAFALGFGEWKVLEPAT